MKTTVAPSTTPDRTLWRRALRGRSMDEATIARRRWWTLAVLNLSLLVIVMDNTILNVALPTLARDLRASGSDLQWMVDAYVLVFAGLLLSAGALGDRFGRRGALSAGLVIFGTGSAAAMMADSAPLLIAARAFMGIGGALIMPAPCPSSPTSSPIPGAGQGHRHSGRPSRGLAVAIGPVVGGWLLEHFWWGSVFAVNVPAWSQRWSRVVRSFPTSRDPEAPPLDIPGAVGLDRRPRRARVGDHRRRRAGWTAAGPRIGFVVATVALLALRGLGAPHAVPDARHRVLP